MLEKNDVVQFNENHKWCGSFGFVREIKEYDDGTIRYMVGVPVPTKGTAYIFVTDKENALERIGQAVLTPKEEEDDK